MEAPRHGDYGLAVLPLRYLYEIVFFAGALAAFLGFLRYLRKKRAYRDEGEEGEEGDDVFPP